MLKEEEEEEEENVSIISSTHQYEWIGTNLDNNLIWIS